MQKYIHIRRIGKKLQVKEITLRNLNSKTFPEILLIGRYQKEKKCLDL